MIALRGRDKLIRCLLGAAGGAVLGLLQYWIDLAGMHRAAATPGLDGIGVAAGFATAYLVVTLVCLCILAALLGLRLWAVVALVLVVGESAVVAALWDVGLGMRTDRKAVLFPIVATLALGTTAVFWPRRNRN